MTATALKTISEETAAILAELDDAPPPSAFKDALGAFYFDVLIDRSSGRPARAWSSPTDVKEYRPIKTPNRKRQRPIRPSDLLAHFSGQATILAGGTPPGVEEPTPIQRAIVVDVDLPAVSSGREATVEEKRAGAEVVERVLGTFGVPFLTFDSARGTHTWVRLAENPSEELLAALRRLLRDTGEKRGVEAEFEVFPYGAKQIRLPFGAYLGVERRPFDVELDDDEIHEWLARPLRPTRQQLEALVAAAPPKPAPDPSEVVAATSREPRPVPSQPVPSPPREAIADPPAPVTGWESWPPCQRALAIEGFAPGRRHYGVLRLANEAAEHGERDEARIVELIARVPRPQSETPDHEHRAEARAAARSALKLVAAGDPRRWAGCGRAASHSGLSDGATQRAAFQHLCTPERAASCPLHVQHQRSYDLTPFAPVTQSSIWRDGRGQYGKGLGPQMKAVYQLVAGKSQRDPNRVVPAAKDWIALTLLDDVGERKVGSYLTSLVHHGLLIELQPGENGIRRFTVPHRDAAWVERLEEKLGTKGVRERKRARILSDIEKRRKRLPVG